MFNLISGIQPFFSHNFEKMILLNTQARVSFRGQIWEHVTPNWIELIKQMLIPNAEMRLSATEVLDHSWFVRGRTTGGLNVPVKRRVSGRSLSLYPDKSKSIDLGSEDDKYKPQLKSYIIVWTKN